MSKLVDARRAFGRQLDAKVVERTLAALDHLVAACAEDGEGGIRIGHGSYIFHQESGPAVTASTGPHRSMGVLISAPPKGRDISLTCPLVDELSRIQDHRESIRANAEWAANALRLPWTVGEDAEMLAVCETIAALAAIADERADPAVSCQISHAEEKFEILVSSTGSLGWNRSASEDAHELVRRTWTPSLEIRSAKQGRKTTTLSIGLGSPTMGFSDKPDGMEAMRIARRTGIDPLATWRTETEKA